MIVDSRPYLVFSVLLMLCILEALAGSSAQNRDGDLSQELQSRGRLDGLALIRTSAGDQWDVVQMGDEPKTIANPQRGSGAWFSPNGSFAAWQIVTWPKPLETCPNALLVAMVDGTQTWQLPGSVINPAAIAVTDDGNRVAFDATYKPAGSGFLGTPRNRQNWITGLQVADRDSNSVLLIRPVKDSFDGRPGEHVGWISWSPNGQNLVYDFGGQIYLYDVQSKTSTALVRGSKPTWSPDGKRIAFVSTDFEAQVIDPATKKSQVLIPQRKVLGRIHWSPDSKYVMFAERRLSWVPLVNGSTQLVVYRLSDGANVPVHQFGLTDLGSDHGFFWVNDSAKFLRHASFRPKIMPCDRP